ncbi:hypothetical protein OHA40_01985 [Nocardia sp. NBC_00508]|uniref:hypothetical protein n=1 Tax=Nocardia sp. NBC_00508 TaxID=2975992 RepID=UPI002E80E868|nr:hypothetical protein [Nocardia sp. NBC_00508]WUD66963.1 hypothetical protein OHA40_01985 [Nocardia sp. NBC_00508]
MVVQCAHQAAGPLRYHVEYLHALHEAVADAVLDHVVYPDIFAQVHFQGVGGDLEYLDLSFGVGPVAPLVNPDGGYR